jgi:dihydroxyacetone kinase-like protein
MIVKSDTWKWIFIQIADRMEHEQEYLSELDRAIGDGDHGTTMYLGWKAIKEKLSELQEQRDCGEISKALAVVFLNATGSSVGPLYASAFLSGGKILENKAELSGDDIVAFWKAVVKGIQERGKAKVGDKTMLDTWIPAVEALVEAYEQSQDLIAALHSAVIRGEQGMKATIQMKAGKGRSSRLGDRALGHQDPGATSAYFILDTFFRCLQASEILF